MKARLWLCGTIAIAGILWAGVSHGSQWSFGLSAGGSQPQGDGSEFWSTGYHVAAHGFYSVGRYVSIGGRVAYNRWSTDESVVNSFLRQTHPTEPPTAISTSGNLDIIEFAPAVRLSSASLFRPNLEGFVQLGGGLYKGDFKGDVFASFDQAGAPITITMTGPENETDFGINFGIGLLLRISESLWVEAMPLYHIIFHEAEGEENTEYGSASIGLSYRR